MAFFSQRMAGDIQGRQSANAMIAEQLVGTLAPLALNAAMMVFYLVVMLRYSVLLTLIGLVSILANLVLSSVISKKRINLTRVQMRDAGQARRDDRRRHRDDRNDQGERRGERLF